MTAPIVDDGDLDFIWTLLYVQDMEPEAITAAYGYTVERIRAACGEHGHMFTTYDRGDATTPYFETWRCCYVCGAPDDGEPYWNEP